MHKTIVKNRIIEHFLCRTCFNKTNGLVLQNKTDMSYFNFLKDRYTFN